MQELYSKTKELEDLTLSLDNVINEYSKIIMKIEEIHFLQLKIETKLELDKQVKEEYKEWKENKLNLIFWLIRLGKYIANYKKQNIVLSESENISLKNLIQFLTKYNYICKQNSENDIKEKIEIQINNLFQNIFKTDKKLIKNKDIIAKIVPYFEYSPSINDNIVPAFPTTNNNNHNYFKDSFKIDLHTKLFSDQSLDLYTCCYYDVNLPRKVYALLVNNGEENMVINNEEELQKLKDYKIIGVQGLCEEMLEGWYKIEDIKFI